MMNKRCILDHRYRMFYCGRRSLLILTWYAIQANNATKVAQTVVENVEHVATVVSSTLQI